MVILMVRNGGRNALKRLCCGYAAELEFIPVCIGSDHLFQNSSAGEQEQAFFSKLLGKT